jgi:putative ABC transport system permease protein
MGDSVLGDDSVEIIGDPAPADGQRPHADLAVVSPSYFSTVDLPVVAGRIFDSHDTRDSPLVCIVNEAFARKLLSGRSPVGMRIALGASDQPTAKPTVREIVGVARQIVQRPDEREPFLQVYVPLAQAPVDDMFLTIRPATGSAAALTAPVRAAIARVDKAQLVSVRDIITLDDVAWDATGRQRFRAIMVMTFAGLALLLAMVGVFGILAYAVQQSAKDLAVRRALGATSGDVARLVAASAFRVVAAGTIAGLVLSIALSRLVTTMLFGVTPLDPTTFAFVLAVLCVTAAVAIAGPAWRASKVEPARVLRDA